MKKQHAITIGALIIGSSIIWGAVIIGAALILKGTPYKDSIQKLLYGGVIAHFILIWAPLAAAMKKVQKENRNSIKKIT